jgi:hypothetical protein
MMHYAAKTGEYALSSCGTPVTKALHTVDWLEWGQVTCPDCLLILAGIEAIFDAIFLSGSLNTPKVECAIPAVSTLTCTQTERQ